MSFYFEAPSGMNADKLMILLGEKFEITLISSQYTLKTYFDTFDWRLWRNGLICEFARTQTGSTLCLIDRKRNRLLDSIDLVDVPAFAHQLNTGNFRKKLEELVENRALLAIGTLECEVSHLDIVDAKNKMLLRLILEEFVLLKHRLSILPFKGADTLIKELQNSLVETMGFAVKKTPALVELLNLQGRQPKDYSNKIALALTPEMEAKQASKSLFLQLFKLIRQNEQGVINDIDPEFLHDYRIAIRKTRSSLKQFQGLYSGTNLSSHINFFNWLGQITSEARDTDVYLQNIQSYQKYLPKTLRHGILPFQDALSRKKSKNHKLLAQRLQSKKYITGMEKWHQCLTAVDRDNPIASESIDIKTFSSLLIWKLFKKISKEGQSISFDSPPEALHRMRKRLKKLRYTIEFFQILYHEDKCKKLLASIKELLSLLGNYQDCIVQQAQLQAFADRMASGKTDLLSTKAVWYLIDYLERRQKKYREKFFKEFEQFDSADKKAKFKRLFHSADKVLRHNLKW